MPLKNNLLGAHEEQKRSYHRGNLRHLIQETSLELIAEKGIRALTLREIGSRLGVSRMAPYRHFADKSALLASLAIAGFNEFANALGQARESAGEDFLQQLNAMGEAYVTFASHRRAHFDVMFGAGNEAIFQNAEAAAAGQRAFDLLERTIADGQAAGQLVAGNPNTLARMVWALVHGISLLSLDPPEGPAVGTFTRTCLEYLQTGLAKHNDTNSDPPNPGRPLVRSSPRRLPSKR